MMEIYCIANGEVQNVSYRAYVQDAAAELALSGWVKNTDDGSVVVCAQGYPDELKLFVEYLHEGSLRSKVAAVSVDWRTPKIVYDDFSIVHT